MQLHRLVVVTFALISPLACVTDVKGESCGLLDALSAGDETYCPDENAPDDCEDLKTVAVEWFVGCGLPEESARDAADDAFDCDDAVATSVDFDECINSLEEECTEIELPEVCEGAIKIGG